MELNLEKKKEILSQKGWVIVEDALDVESEQLSDWVDHISVKPGKEAKRLHYYEKTNLSPSLCRIERFIEDHSELKRLVSDGVVIETITGLFGEPVKLYKEKVNIKNPGGAGFRPHQDATAYENLSQHITCLIAVDDMTPENGCLEFADSLPNKKLDQDSYGCIPQEIYEDFKWTEATLKRGSILCFTALIPHRSGPNKTDLPRRAIYLTFNSAAEGDLRKKYYLERDQFLAKLQPQEKQITAFLENILTKTQ